jgi:putative colanic acid biosysnthesis UDP-glucose lipid carrier transferase
MQRNAYNKMLRYIVFIEIIDLITLNILLGAYLLFEHFISPGSSYETHYIQYGFIFNITYFISINVVYGLLHSRLIRAEVVISQVSRTLLLQILLFLSVMSYLSIPAPSILAVIIYFIVTFGAVSTERLLIRYTIKHLHHQGCDSMRVIFLGSGPEMQPIADIMNDPWNGYNLLGTFSDDPNNHLKKVKRLGFVADACDYVHQNEIEEVYCGLSERAAPELESLFRICNLQVIRIYLVPTIHNIMSRRTYIKDFGDSKIFTLHREPLEVYYNRLLKRCFDIIFSGLFLLIIYPIFYLVIAIITKLTNPGPVYFIQDRTGYNGETFKCLKFRSMCVNDQADNLQATANDTRITYFGRFLRKSSIDEFPQFINVFRGEMSVVGPRPHMLAHTEYYSNLISEYMVRHYIRPGVTGWAQVSGCRGETKTTTEMEKRVKKDIWYIEHWSVWLDIIIILKTIFGVFIPDQKAR